MKYFNFTLFFVLALWSSCGTSSKEAAHFNDFIVQSYTREGLYTDSLINILNLNDSAQIMSKFKTLKAQSLLSIQNMNKFNYPSEDSIYFNAGINLFLAYDSVINNEIKKLSQLQALPTESITIEHYREINKLQDSIEFKINRSFQVFLLEQKKYSEKYNLDLK